MPSVVGMVFADARDVLKGRGFTVKRNERYLASVPAEEVLGQSPEVGAIVDLGATVKLTVAIAFPAPVNGNPWGYNWACCKKIFTPPADFCSFFACVTTFHNGTGYVVQCRDDLFSATGGSKQVCSGHDGRQRTLFSP
jgi:PASTA domain-containing protein